MGKMSRTCSKTFSHTVDSKPIEVTEKYEIADPLVEFDMDWQEVTISTVFFSTGLMMTRDSQEALSLCQTALSCMGYRNGLASEITRLVLTEKERKVHKKLFKTIVSRLHDERYVKPLLISI